LQHAAARIEAARQAIGERGAGGGVRCRGIKIAQKLGKLVRVDVRRCAPVFVARVLHLSFRKTHHARTSWDG